MSKKLVILFAVASILLIGIGVVAAQGQGNGYGNCDPLSDTCGTTSQFNMYGRGGNGFAQTGGWNGAQGGRMNGAGQNGTGYYATLPQAYAGELPQNVVDLMIAGWLDEQRAYAVYEAVIGQFGEIAPFVNIQRAEAQHIAAWETLFSRYDIAQPELPVVDVPEFASVADACQTGVDAEISNAALYDTMLDIFAEYPDIYQVALSLSNASEFSHLPAFERCAG